MGNNADTRIKDETLTLMYRLRDSIPISMSEARTLAYGLLAIKTRGRKNRQLILYTLEKHVQHYNIELYDEYWQLIELRWGFKRNK